MLFHVIGRGGGGGVGRGLFVDDYLGSYSRPGPHGSGRENLSTHPDLLLTSLSRFRI